MDEKERQKILDDLFEEAKQKALGMTPQEAAAAEGDVYKMVREQGAEGALKLSQSILLAVDRLGKEAGFTVGLQLGFIGSVVVAYAHAEKTGDVVSKEALKQLAMALSIPPLALTRVVHDESMFLARQFMQ